MTLNKITYQFESDNTLIQSLLDLIYSIGINNILGVILFIMAVIIFYFAEKHNQAGE